MPNSVHEDNTADMAEPNDPNVTLTFYGRIADQGEMPAAELGVALQGWDRLLQLAYYSQHASILEVPKPGTSFRVEFHVRRISKGSLLVSAVLWIANSAGSELVGEGAKVALGKLVKWASKMIKAHIEAKSVQRTLDGAVDAIDAVARGEGIRVSKNRVDSEDFATALNTALMNATVPLDSSAAKQVLSLKGQVVDIVIDDNDRVALRAPFEPPALDPNAEPVIEVPVKFIRINRKTGSGLLTFIRPTDESQLGQQRFRCEDKSIRGRANNYTGAFHEDTALVVRVQRKAYEKTRHGHYWLIVGPARTRVDEVGLFGPNDEQKRVKKRKPA